MEIKSLKGIDFNALYKAFNQAFADYEMQLDKMQLQSMLKRRGFNPDLSFAAFDKDGIVAFTFNGIGDFNGLSTAYDTGTGTLKEYRGRGLASQIFEYSVPYLREMGIKQYLLEVLQHNPKAISVYTKQGFETTREFYYFRQKSEKIENKIKAIDYPYTIKPISINDFDSITRFWDFIPSWQNSLESIDRAKDDFVSLGLFFENRLVGYSVFEPTSGDITQLAVDKQERRKGIASLLLKEMIDLNKNDSVKVINTDITNDPLTHFLQSKNIPIAGKQFEMIKKI